MNNVFSPKRFGNYLLHDLKTAKDNNLYSFLIIAGLPVLMFIFIELVAIIFSKEHAFCEYNEITQILSLVFATAAAVIVFPIKQYGQITEKRYGSSWLMLPASRFEKWLSIILMTCVILPICLYVVFFGLDSLMSVIFPKYYPEALLSNGNNFKELSEDFGGAEFTMNPLGVSWMCWVESILVFTLGAVFFKKAKFPKTLLCVMAFGMIVSTICVVAFGHDLQNLESWMDRFTDYSPEEAIKRAKTTLYISYSIFIIILGGGIYLRTAKIKH